MDQHRLNQRAVEGGLNAIGVCLADPFTEVAKTLTDRKSEGLNGKLGFTYVQPEVSTDIRRTYPWAERLVVGIRSYVPESGTPEHAPVSAVVARFAVDDAYQPLVAGLEIVADALRAEGWRAEVIADDNRLVDRAAAVRAGVGWWGKNTMVLAPKVGPWVLIGSVVTDALLEITQPMKRDCGTCDACIPACPTGALVAPGVLDARRCLAAWAQAPGVIPAEYREAMGDRLYGCDDCLDACPPGIRLLDSATLARGMVDIRWLLGASDQELLDRFDRWYIPKRDPKYVRRNALIVAGNSGDPTLVDQVVPYLGHPSSIVRQHAAWALGRIGGSDSVASLEQARHDETLYEVKREIDVALQEAR
ncbi:MAG: tRNA epoxyqueuosine(34) reductase QueG [Acidimicrobiia bacterium]|nr:tRNA epoxyqueuosine(34) reductase QueG [Acidimicrobiia bacterium]